MKVVLLAPTPPPAGGIASWTVRMMNAQLKNGWKVAVVDEKTIGNRQVFGEANKRNFFDEIKRCFGIWSKLNGELKDHEAKVVHSCIPSVTFAMIREYICACITHLHKRKFIIHFRCTVPNTTKGKIGNFILKKLCDKSDMIMILNNQTEEYLSHITKTPRVLIPNFISNDEIDPDYEVRTEMKTVTYIGGVIETKGAYDILKIAERLTDLQFRLVGKSDGNIEEYAKQQGIKNVVFTGPVDKEGVKQELKNADVFLFMTYFYGEGFSNSLAEAMAMGLPCVVTDWAANADMIGETGGAVVAVKDVDAAVEAINSMRPLEIREAQSSANIKKVKDFYVDTVVLDQYVDAYESIM